MHTWAFDATQSRTGRQGFGWRALMYGVRYRFICICTVIFPTTWSLRSVESHAVSANSLGLYPQTSAARLRDEMKYMHVCCIAILYKSEAEPTRFFTHTHIRTRLMGYGNGARAPRHANVLLTFICSNELYGGAAQGRSKRPRHSRPQRSRPRPEYTARDAPLAPPRPKNCVVTSTHTTFPLPPTTKIFSHITPRDQQKTLFTIDALVTATSFLYGLPAASLIALTP